MKITKSELVQTCIDLIDQGYTRCKGDKHHQEGKSIQEHFENLSEKEISKSEVRSWFSNLEELKGIRVKPHQSKVISIVSEEEFVEDNANTGISSSITPNSEENTENIPQSGPELPYADIPEDEDDLDSGIM